jgi:hypothetical protein
MRIGPPNQEPGRRPAKTAIMPSAAECSKLGIDRVEVTVSSVPVYLSISSWWGRIFHSWVWSSQVFHPPICSSHSLTDFSASGSA